MSQNNGDNPSNSGTEILLADNLRKVYEARPALKGLSFSLKRQAVGVIRRGR